jgi:hypothetical protein
MYIYQGDLYCDDCGRKIQEALKNEGKAPKAPNNEDSYYETEYPKWVEVGESDCPQHCGADDCLNAIEIDWDGDNWEIGAWLETRLTDDGVAYVRAAIAKGGLLATLWAELYADCL